MIIEVYFVTKSVVQTTILEEVSRQKLSNQANNKAPPGQIRWGGKCSG